VVVSWFVISICRKFGNFLASRAASSREEPGDQSGLRIKDCRLGREKRYWSE
jgi:hypothetical protein